MIFFIYFAKQMYFCQICNVFFSLKTWFLALFVNKILNMTLVSVFIAVRHRLNRYLIRVFDIECVRLFFVILSNKKSLV